MKITDYFENFIKFKDEDSKLEVSSILNATAKKGFSGFGKRWESLLIKYFKVFNSTKITDTNPQGGAQSAFSDIKVGNNFVSLKFVENKKAWNQNLIDNFTGDTAWLVTNTALKDMKTPGSKSAFIEEEYSKNKMSSLKKNISPDNFSVMIFCFVEENGQTFLNGRVSETRSGKQCFDFCLKRLDNNGGSSQRLNAGDPKIYNELFQMKEEVNIKLEGESNDISSFKEMIKSDLIKKSFKTEKEFKSQAKKTFGKIV